MKHGQATQAASRPLFAQAVMVMAGLGYTIAGAALLFAPEWFFQNIGYFPPFSRHYAGDVGRLCSPSERNQPSARGAQPIQASALLGTATGGSVLHALNHMYAAAVGRHLLSTGS